MARKGGRSEKNFEIGPCVPAENFSTGKRWLEGMTFRPIGPTSYQIELADECIIHQHVNHIHLRTFGSQPATERNTDDWTDSMPSTVSTAGSITNREAVEFEQIPPAPPEIPETRNQSRHPQHSTQGIPPDYLRY